MDRILRARPGSDGVTDFFLVHGAWCGSAV